MIHHPSLCATEREGVNAFSCDKKIMFYAIASERKNKLYKCLRPLLMPLTCYCLPLMHPHWIKKKYDFHSDAYTCSTPCGSVGRQMFRHGHTRHLSKVLPNKFQQSLLFTHVGCTLLWKIIPIYITHSTVQTLLL